MWKHSRAAASSCSRAGGAMRRHGRSFALSTRTDQPRACARSTSSQHVPVCSDSCSDTRRDMTPLNTLPAPGMTTSSGAVRACSPGVAYTVVCSMPGAPVSTTRSRPARAVSSVSISAATRAPIASNSRTDARSISNGCPSASTIRSSLSSTNPRASVLSATHSSSSLSFLSSSSFFFSSILASPLPSTLPISPSFSRSVAFERCQ